MKNFKIIKKKKLIKIKNEGIKNNYEDLFKDQKFSKNYAQFRPTYQKELYTEIINFMNNSERKICADIGSGSGQATKDLIPYFEKVYGIEPSLTQISSAYKNGIYLLKKEKIEYINATSENTLLKDNSIDLITVAQAYQ
jgi:ubiquinone/menaquinone biosynthesis C-methylase UbiE